MNLLVDCLVFDSDEVMVMAMGDLGKEVVVEKMKDGRGSRKSLHSLPCRRREV